MLTVDRHDRNIVGFTYVYPVVSRRARGVSIGINLNPNSACNWRCVYCQVPGLVRGGAPDIDLGRLERELDSMLEAAVRGDFLERHVEPHLRQLRDVAFSGNGEPTSSPQFREAVDVVSEAIRRAGVSLPIVVITNGSLVGRASVQDTFRHLGAMGGRIWFKLDAGTDAGMRSTNSVHTRVARQLDRLRLTSTLCATWVQSCWFVRRDNEPDPVEVDHYVRSLGALWREGVPLKGVYLYTLARTPSQPEVSELGPVTQVWLERLAQRLRDEGLTVDEPPPVG
jgi:pyruvate-formate lyase-activating enzyme